MKTKISFDYDGVLTQAVYQEEAKKLIASGQYSVCIVTARKDQDPQVLAAAKLLGISEIHFTEDKVKTLNEILADAHFDDSMDQINKIKACRKTLGVHAKRAMNVRRSKEKY